MKVKELCKEERPREKLIERGAKAMTNAELLAILLRTGTGEKNVIELANEMLSKTEGGLTGLSAAGIQQLCEFKGVGQDKAVTLAAAFELGCRCTADRMKPQVLEIRSPETVFKLMFPKMMGTDHEECWVIYLNRSNRLIGTEKISSGGLSETVMDLPGIVRKSLEKKASAVIITHNHPSGNPTPSQADIEMTGKLKHALGLLDIALIDHVVIADGCWYSFAEEETRYYKEDVVSDRN